MLWLAFFSILIVMLSMAMAFTAYTCLAWYKHSRVHSTSNTDFAPGGRVVKGLSPSDLERLPGMEFADPAGTECAVCLEDVEMGQAARVLPGCRHAFHRACADAWLAKIAACPLCRAVPLSSPPPPSS